MKGQRVVFIEDFHFNNKTYKKGHQFVITNADGMRGYDLEDEEGNRICETRLISHKYVLLSEFRNDKLNELGI